METSMIPKRFNWVWLGTSIPEKDQKWIASWRLLNPEYECVVWSDHPDTLVVPRGVEARDLPPLINTWVVENIEKWVTGRAIVAAKSDIWRMEIIARCGGIYLDTDVEAIRPLGSILDGVRLFVSDEWGPCVGNYMFGATANHPALWTCVRELEGRLKKIDKALNAVEATGPIYLNEQLRKYSNELVIFPHRIFNPLCAWDDPNQVKKWPACTIANHHFDGKWYDRVKNVPPKEFLE